MGINKEKIVSSEMVDKLKGSMKEPTHHNLIIFGGLRDEKPALYAFQ